ncbi:MAG: nuclear transport factor 2 family protein [Pyrinomonadaceae bacterium]
MKLGSVLFAVVVILVGVAIDANGQKVSEKDELLTFDRQWQEAVVTGDVKFIEKRTADDFVFTHGGGTMVDTKADWVRRTKQVPQRQLQRKASNQTVEIHGDIALVFGRLDVRAITKPDSPPVCYALEYVHLYARRKGQWMFLSHRTTQGIGTAHPCTESESK